MDERKEIIINSFLDLIGVVTTREDLVSFIEAVERARDELTDELKRGCQTLNAVVVTLFRNLCPEEFDVFPKGYWPYEGHVKFLEMEFPGLEAPTLEEVRDAVVEWVKDKYTVGMTCDGPDGSCIITGGDGLSRDVVYTSGMQSSVNILRLKPRCKELN